MEASEILTTTRFDVAEFWIGDERAPDPLGEFLTVEVMIEAL